MDFPEENKRLINQLIPKMEYYVSKSHSKHIQDTVDELLMLLYHKIQTAETSYYSIRDRGLIRDYVEDISSSLFLQSSDILASRYVPESIKNEINTNVNKVIVYNFTIQSKKIQIEFGVNNVNEHNKEKIDAMAKRMYIWLHILNKIAAKTCARKLVVKVFLSNKKKYIPDNINTVIGPENVNGGVSNLCSYKNEILIFRTEEWFKVFVHETMHTFNLDFSSMNDITLRTKLLNLFPVDTSMDASEAYSEFWATIINCAFCAYNMTVKKGEDGKKRPYSNIKQDYIDYADLCIALERLFSVLQCAKVLHHMGITYNMLFIDNSMYVKLRKMYYKEYSNVFSYYILKCILLFHYGDFISWCKNNNRINIFRFTKSEKNLVNLYDFIEKRFDNNNFLINVNELFVFYNNLKKKEHLSDDEKMFLTTLKMTISDIC